MLGLGPEQLRQFGLFGIIVSEVSGTNIFFAGLGWWGYREWGWPIWLSALLAVAGFALSMVRLYFTVKKEFRK